MTTETASHRIYAWKRILDHGSFEHATVERRGAAGWIRSDVLAVHEGTPLRLTYTLATDDQGRSRHLALEQTYGGHSRRLVLERTPEGWWLDGRAAPELAECVDIDLGLSPSTNALPIGRMAAAGTTQSEVQVAWVRFPALSVTPATQRYTRLSATTWRYESVTSGFSAELEVDDWHLPLHYAGVWEQAGVDHGHGEASRGGFAEALLALAPAPDIAAYAADFEWLVGGWDATIQDYAADGTVKRSRGECWFAWVLEGRAMQDLWISPPRAERAGLAPGAPQGRYGTTIRRYDHSRGQWRITWINPASGAENELTGTRQGDRIVLLGTAQGTPIKWQFVDIRPDQFTWQGYRLDRDGQTWRLETQYELRRKGTRSPSLSEMP